MKKGGMAEKHWTMDRGTMATPWYPILGPPFRETSSDEPGAVQLPSWQAKAVHQEAQKNISWWHNWPKKPEYNGIQYIEYIRHTHTYIIKSYKHMMKNEDATKTSSLLVLACLCLRQENRTCVLLLFGVLLFVLGLGWGGVGGHVNVPGTSYMIYCHVAKISGIAYYVTCCYAAEISSVGWGGVRGHVNVPGTSYMIYCHVAKISGIAYYVTCCYASTFDASTFDAHDVYLICQKSIDFASTFFWPKFSFPKSSEEHFIL